MKAGQPISFNLRGYSNKQTPSYRSKCNAVVTMETTCKSSCLCPTLIIAACVY